MLAAMASPNFVQPESPDEPALADYRAVRDRDLLGPEGRGGLFIGETPLVVRAMLARPGMTKSVLIADERRTALEDDLAGFDGPVYLVPLAWMERITGYPLHRGILAIGHRPDPDGVTLERVLARTGKSASDPLTLLICVGINNIDNIGLLFRNAAAFAVDAVLLDPSCHDPLYRKSLRVSIGHVLSMPWARSSPADWPGDLDRLRKEWGITLIGAATGDRAQSIDSIDRPARVGVVVGPEYEGLPADVLERCDALARIPMAANVDSLNVGVASAVALHRFSRGERV